MSDISCQTFRHEAIFLSKMSTIYKTARALSARTGINGVKRSFTSSSITRNELKIADLHTFTEEEQMFKEAGTFD
jgi:hypothetical protein